MIRVTIKDGEQTISFLAHREIADRLVAGCSANPATVGELLLATEVFQRGIASAIMASLMEFDKALRRLGPSSAYATTAYAATAAAEGEESVRNAFQVVDEPTRAAAFLPRGAGPGAGLIILDLPQRTIRASGNLPIPASGEILAHDGKALTDRAITYILPQEWSIQTL